MPKKREIKKKIIEDLKKEISKTKVIIFADYYNLSVKKMEELRKRLKKKDGKYVVVKKNFLRIALKEIGLENINLEELKGGISLAFHDQDEILPAKILNQFSKEHKELRIQGGILEKKFIDPAKITELAKLPEKEELIAKLIYFIKTPLSGFLRVLEGNLKSFVYLLKVIKKTT